VKVQEFADMRYSLVITDLRPEDQGKYEVVAINAAGEARCEAEVSIPEAPAPVVKPAVPTEEAKFVKALVKESKATEGETFSIATQVQAQGRCVRSSVG
jgi:titin